MAVIACVLRAAVSARDGTLDRQRRPALPEPQRSSRHQIRLIVGADLALPGAAPGLRHRSNCRRARHPAPGCATLIDQGAEVVTVPAWARLGQVRPEVGVHFHAGRMTGDRLMA